MKKELTVDQLIQETIAYFLTRPMGEAEPFVQAWRQVKITPPEAPTEPAEDKD